MGVARLRELEEMAGKLATVRKLSPGQDRHSALPEIGRFRARIAALGGGASRLKQGGNNGASRSWNSAPWRAGITSID
jgi:hypothetical protein